MPASGAEPGLLATFWAVGPRCWLVCRRDPILFVPSTDMAPEEDPRHKSGTWGPAESRRTLRSPDGR